MHRGGGRGQEGLEGGCHPDERRRRFYQRDEAKKGHRGEVQN